MNGTSVTSQTTLAVLGTGFTLVGAGDHNGGNQPWSLPVPEHQHRTGGDLEHERDSMAGSTTLASPGCVWHANAS